MNKIIKIILILIVFIVIKPAAQETTDSQADLPLQMPFKLNVLCPICLNPEDQSAYVETCCQNDSAHHVFHEQCFYKLVNSEIYNCPVCRYDLSDKDDPSIINVYLINPRQLIVAAVDGELEKVKRFISYGIDINCKKDAQDIFVDLSTHEDEALFFSKIGFVNPVIAAAVTGNWKIVDYLLDQKVDLSGIIGNILLRDAILQQKIETIKSLIVLDSIDLNQADIFGKTFLISAIVKDNLDIVKILLQAGADVNGVAVITGNTPLLIAGYCNKSLVNRESIVQCLLDYGADANIKNYEGKGVLELHLELLNLVSKPV